MCVCLSLINPKHLPGVEKHAHKRWGIWSRRKYYYSTKLAKIIKKKPLALLTTNDNWAKREITLGLSANVLEIHAPSELSGRGSERAG